jgi:hypothetical protein
LVASRLLSPSVSMCVFVILMLLAGCGRISASASLICHACVSDRLHSLRALESRQLSCRSEGLAVAKASPIRQAPGSSGLLVGTHFLGIPSYLSIPMDGLHIDVLMGSIRACLVPPLVIRANQCRIHGRSSGVWAYLRRSIRAHAGIALLAIAHVG